MGGMELVAHHRVGKIQEEGKGVGTGVGHLRDGVETMKSVFMAMALLHHSVTEKNVSYGLELASDLIGEILKWQSQFHLFMTVR